jgi:hypothetical protein
VQVEGIAIDIGKNICLVANLIGGAAPGYETFRYDDAGNLIWIAYPNENLTSRSSGLALGNAGDLFLTGKAGNDYPNFFYGTFEVGSNGSPLWTNFYPQPSVGVSVASSIVTDSANNCYVTGYSPGTNSGNDIVTIKYGPNGNQIWLQRYNGPGNGDDAGNAIAVDNKGNVYVTGYETTAAGGTEIVTIKYSPVALQRRADGTVLLQAQGSPGESFDLQGSTDLLNWLDLGSILADSNGVAQFADTNASNYNRRFYVTTPQ